MIRKLGIIAEDKTDVETIQVLARRIDDPRLPVVGRAPAGGTKILAKTPAFLAEFSRHGCDGVVVVHDLDRSPTGDLNDEAALRQRLSKVAGQALICVPIEELEAWFWSDPAVLAQVGGHACAAHANPHKLRSPKEELRRLSRRGGARPRYATADNPRLAESLDLDLCASRCPAFQDLRSFLLSR
jgi:hypothetical protein